jgi:hypothetical protein
MVWFEQRFPVSPRLTGAVFTLAILGLPALGQPSGKKFYPDDPLMREPPPLPATQIKARDVDDLYEFLDNSFEVPRRLGKIARQPHPAQDVNTLGDVPNSPWYTNRHYYHRMSIEELKRGPGNSTPPTGVWRVVSAKTNGVSPGFVIEDDRKNRYVVKLDPPDDPELASAADVIGSKFFYALGYSTPENYIVHFNRESLEVANGVMFTDATGRKRPLTRRILDDILRDQPKGRDGSYRAMASRYIAGKLVGPFSYEGMRTDDPNDIVPHEDRRELRGLAVFAAWLDHHDTRSINSMDSLIEENGVPYLKHYLLDFGSILGSNGTGPKHPWSGHEYTLDGKGTLIGLATFGFDLPRWSRTDYPSFTGVGRFDSWSFDPMSWKPNYPNPAFLLMDRQDAFWAAKQVAAFSDDEIRALVETGEYSDPRAAQWIAESLMKRRDKIAEAWFSKVLPLDKFSVADGKLTFHGLQAGSGTESGGEYSVRWASCDRNGQITPLPHAAGMQIPVFPGGTEYLAATIKPAGSEAENDDPLTVYLRHGKTGLEVVGIDR